MYYKGYNSQKTAAGKSIANKLHPKKRLWFKHRTKPLLTNVDNMTQTLDTLTKIWKKISPN